MLAPHRVAAKLQFVKNALPPKCEKGRHNKIKCACKHNFQVFEMLSIRGHGSYFQAENFLLFSPIPTGEGGFHDR